MYAKLKLTANLEVVTGLHIGGSSTFSAIGAVDSPVIRDTLSGLPLIPGSSLKGKLRTLLARSMQQKAFRLPAHKEDHPEILRLFGASDPIIPSRLQFCDAFLSNAEELREIGTTEVKFENTINRITSVANPRQIERVIRGTKFAFVLIYDADEEREIQGDITNLAAALRLLQMDYLGGHGTRGYGKVKFTDFSVECVSGAIESEMITQLSDILKEVEQDELLPL